MLQFPNSLQTHCHLPSATCLNLLYMNMQVCLYLFVCSRWQRKRGIKNQILFYIIFMFLLIRKPSFFKTQLSVIYKWNNQILTRLTSCEKNYILQIRISCDQNPWRWNKQGWFCTLFRLMITDPFHPNYSRTGWVSWVLQRSVSYVPQN